MPERIDRPDDLQEAMAQANRDHARRTRRAHLRTRASQATLVLLFSGTALFVAAVRSGLGDQSPRPRARTSTTDPVVGFDFSDAVPVCLEREGRSVRGTVPSTFGRVERIALVGQDLTATIWEVLATPGVDLTSFEIGSTPPGFSAEQPLQGEVAPDGIVVFNGPTSVGMAALDRTEIGAAGTCS